MFRSPFVGTHRFVVRALKLDGGQLSSVSGYVPLGIIWDVILEENTMMKTRGLYVLTMCRVLILVEYKCHNDEKYFMIVVRQCRSKEVAGERQPEL
jgi:hypothetical protein